MKPVARTSHSSECGFTLIEVILGIGIAAGILMVVLFFYRQSELLRNRLLVESSRLSAVRLVLERLTVELSAARRCESFQQGLVGEPDRVQFVKLDFPKAATWTNQPGAIGATPFRLVSYSVRGSGGPDGETGLVRSEEILSMHTSAITATPIDPSVEAVAPAAPAGMAAAQVQFLRFRYYDGATWYESWTAPTLPIGIEVTLGGESLPAELPPEDYPFELYRRVIYLPNYAADRSYTQTNVLAMGGIAP